jgi:hypothetical protein
MYDNFYKESVCVLDKFPEHHMKMLLDFNSKVHREDIFKSLTRNESLHRISKDNRAHGLNFATSKILTDSSTMFLHCNIQLKLLNY